MVYLGDYAHPAYITNYIHRHVGPAASASHAIARPRPMPLPLLKCSDGFFLGGVIVLPLSFGDYI